MEESQLVITGKSQTQVTSLGLAQMSCKYLYMVIHYLDVYLWCSFLCSMINWKILHIVANCLFFIEISWIVARAPLFLNFLCIQIIKELWVQWWDNYKHSSIITCTQMTLNYSWTVFKTNCKSLIPVHDQYYTCIFFTLTYPWFMLYHVSCK